MLGAPRSLTKNQPKCLNLIKIYFGKYYQLEGLKILLPLLSVKVFGN